MKDSSSNNQMENKLDILSKIQTVSAPDDLYAAVLSKIANTRKNTISLTWVKSAAAVLVVFLVSETYLVLKTNSSAGTNASNSIESIAPITSNQLYYE
ncbi:MAG: hypothetical protein WC044_08645 [Crocinitomicaceae bacterium]